jgi:hypothetical protein
MIPISSRAINFPLRGKKKFAVARMLSFVLRENSVY